MKNAKALEKQIKVTTKQTFFFFLADNFFFW